VVLRLWNNCRYLSLDLRPSKNTKGPLVYRQGAFLSNTRYIGSDAFILPR
jgi:hypothetical protein